MAEETERRNTVVENKNNMKINENSAWRKLITAK